MSVRIENKDPELALYCKQRTIEKSWQGPWACGFSSIVTAMRLLGDRDTKADQLPRRFERLGYTPTDGLDEDQLVQLVREFGYGVRSFPRPRRESKDDFKQWLLEAWRRNHPTIVSCGGDQDGNDHYAVAYSNPDDSRVWIMDPSEEDVPFEDTDWRDFLEWTRDVNPDHDTWEAHEILPRNAVPNALPPSTRLFEWVNELPGHVATRDAVAVGFLDNFFDAVRDAEPRGARGVPLAPVLASDGELWTKLGNWFDAFYEPEELAEFRAMLRVTQDLDAYFEFRVKPEAIPGLAGDLALVFVHALKHHAWLSGRAA